MNRDYPLAESPSIKDRESINPRRAARQENRQIMRQERKQEREGLRYEPKVTKGQARRFSKYIK
jgi:hypothetical protein